MRIRKPNRVTTPRRAVLNGARASHASIPRARGRWRRGFARNRASAPGRGETAGRPDQDRPGEPVLLPGAGTREVRLVVRLTGCGCSRPQLPTLSGAMTASPSCPTRRGSALPLWSLPMSLTSR